MWRPGVSNGAKDKSKKLKEDRDKCGLSDGKKAGSPSGECPKHWIAFHVVEISGTAKKETAKPLKGTKIPAKLPGLGDTDVVTSKAAQKIKGLDPGTARILQVEPAEAQGWYLEKIETT
jgi:hypothetical protein